jgi:hypothetical protein
VLVLVFILAVTWSIYLGMWLLSRHERRSMSSIVTFNKHLAVLARTSPGPAGEPGAEPDRGLVDVPAADAETVQSVPRMSLAEARNRRRQVLTSLAAAASVTAALAFVGGPAMLVLHLIIDVLLVGYVVALIRVQQAGTEHRSTILYLPNQVSPAMAPAYLQRSAN